MKDIRKNNNLIVVCQNSYPIKKNFLSGVVALVYNQVNLLLNFVQSLIILSLKKNYGGHIFLRVKKIIKFLNFIYNNDFFSKSGWSFDHLGSNVELPVATTNTSIIC